MNTTKRVALLVLILLIVAQVVQPNKNQSAVVSENDISKVMDLPEGVHKIFVEKCYDCHSNNTRYPWYFNVQPIGWWLAAHVHEGKEHLDFSEFGTYPADKRAHEFTDLQEVVEEGTMPLASYVAFHPDSKLTPEDKEKILAWVKRVKN